MLFKCKYLGQICVQRSKVQMAETGSIIDVFAQSETVCKNKTEKLKQKSTKSV